MHYRITFVANIAYIFSLKTEVQSGQSQKAVRCQLVWKRKPTPDVEAKAIELLNAAKGKSELSAFVRAVSSYIRWRNGELCTPERLEYSCVQFIRSHLLSVNDKNIFEIVPKLMVPALIEKMLTYGITLRSDIVSESSP